MIRTASIAVGLTLAALALTLPASTTMRALCVGPDTSDITT
jgi:hypothetical protein